jgi:hypothetical protein
MILWRLLYSWSKPTCSLVFPLDTFRMTLWHQLAIISSWLVQWVKTRPTLYSIWAKEDVKMLRRSQDVKEIWRLHKYDRNPSYLFGVNLDRWPLASPVSAKIMSFVCSWSAFLLQYTQEFFGSRVVRQIDLHFTYVTRAMYIQYTVAQQYNSTVPVYTVYSTA